MKRQTFDALVRLVDARYAGRQRALERATMRWVAFGLAGMLSWLLIVTSLGLLFFVLGLFAEPPASVVLIVIGVPLALYGVYQSLYILSVDVDPPEGYLVAPGEAPALRAMLEELRSELQCRTFDEVRISLNLNASVRELPRLGLLGWSRTVLEIGLPLARAMAPDELKAILAHECVHLSARHGRTASRMYRVNRTWGNLVERMQRPAGDSFTRMSRSAIAKFLDWYWPRLHARGLVLSRAHEYQADREAAQIAGNAAMGSALWRLEGLTPWLSERFWPAVFTATATQPEPPDDIAARLTVAIQTPPDPEAAALWVERGLVRATVHDETHPALLDRVRPLGLTADDLRQIGWPPAARPSAAEVLFADIIAAAERTLSETWRNNTLGPWRDRYRRATAEARRLATAEASATVSTSTAESAPDQPAPLAADIHDLWETARQAVNLQGLVPAIPLLRRVLDRDPNHAGAAVVLGRHLALAGDPEGETMLERVVARNDETWMPRAGEALEEVYRASGRTAQLQAMRARLDQHESDLRASQRERATITAGDTFIAHALTDEQLAALRAQLAERPSLGSAWLVRKQLRHFPNRLLYVLCVRSADRRWWSHNPDVERDLVRRLIPRVELPGQVLVISPQGSFRALARKVMKLPGAEVFRRAEGDR